MTTVIDLATKLAQPSKILVIDDDASILDLVPMCLTSLDLRVDTAGSVDAAIAMLDSTMYDLIILDLLMPSKNGTEFLKHLRNRQMATPVVLVTGYADTDIAQAALELGVCGLIKKPFDCQFLRAQLTRIFDTFKIRYKRQLEL